MIGLVRAHICTPRPSSREGSTARRGRADYSAEAASASRRGARRVGLPICTPRSAATRHSAPPTSSRARRARGPAGAPDRPSTQRCRVIAGAYFTGWAEPRWHPRSNDERDTAPLRHDDSRDAHQDAMDILLPILTAGRVERSLSVGGAAGALTVRALFLGPSVGRLRWTHVAAPMPNAVPARGGVVPRAGRARARSFFTSTTLTGTRPRTSVSAQSSRPSGAI